MTNIPSLPKIERFPKKQNYSAKPRKITGKLEQLVTICQYHNLCVYLCVALI